MTARAIRWSDHDRYFGPLTYARDIKYRKLSVMLGSGDGDDYPGCRLRLSIGSHTLIMALPAVIKPSKRWHEISTPTIRAEMIAAGRKPGYWESYEREYGFTAVEGALHVHYGAQTHEWPGSKSTVFFYPWNDNTIARHSIYDAAGDHFADLNVGPHRKNSWSADEALRAACPVSEFEFDDFDGERIVATCRIEEHEWRQGRGLFRLLYLFRTKTARSLDLRFSSEVGRRKGSWKGGTLGHGITMRPGETPEGAFRRYCEQEGLTFIGPVAA